MITRVALFFVVLSTTTVTDSAKFKVCHKPSSCLSHKECIRRHSTDIVVSNCFNSHPKKVCCPPKEERKRTSLTSHINYSQLPQGEKCGLTLGFKVSGGNDADIRDFPWMVFLTFKTENENESSRCGGTLINEKYVMTAAHCFNSSFPNGGLVSVRLGEYDYSTVIDEIDENNYTHVEAPIEEVIIHEKWNSTTMKNDIALIRIGDFNRSEMNPDIGPICLPLNDEELDWELKIAGWGLNNYDIKKQKTKLQSGTMRRMTMETCRRSLRFKERNYLYPSETKQICAIEMTNTGDKDYQNVCRGDSGGPLMMSENQTLGRKFAIGIVSWQRTSNCFDKFPRPSVFTNVKYYIGWILDHIKK